MATLPMPAPAEQEDPEQLPLSEDGRKALEDLVRKVLGEDKPGRRSEVRKAAKQQFFGKGEQQIYYNSQSYEFMSMEASGLELPRFRSVYNIFTPHKRSFVSILSQNPPGVNFEPEYLSEYKDIAAAKDAEKARRRVDTLVHMKDRQSEVSSSFCTDGRTMARVYADKAGKLRIEVGGVLQWKVPLYVGAMEEWGYAVYSKEIDKWQAKDDYDELSAPTDGDSGGEGSSESTYERIARLGLLSGGKGSGYADSIKNLVTRHIAWIRPSRFRQCPDAVQDELRTRYKDGVRATVISGMLVEEVAEKMEAAVVVGWPSSERGQSRPSLLHDLVNIQEDFNDYMNLLREHIEFSIPATWVTDTVDEEALSDQRSAPGAIHLLTVPAGASINDLVHQEDVAQLPPELVSNIDRLLSLAQFTTGDLPSLSGEGDPHSETAAGQKMLSDQAKGQLSPAWQGLQWFMAQVYEIAVRVAAKLVQDKPSVAVNGPNGQQKFNPSAILEGNFHCYPDTDSSFPETQADKRQAFQEISEQLGQAGPAGLAIVMHPDNLKLGKQLKGLSDFVIPGATARDKQLREIEQLLEESPVPDEDQMPQWQQAAVQAEAAGQPPPPPPMKSSIDVGKRDYHADELAKIVEWLSDPACYEEMVKGNQAGIQNVQLHADQHEAALAKIAQQNAPKPEPPKISLTAQIQDPVAIAQLLGDAGVQTTPQNIQEAAAPDLQEVASKTQLNAAKTQHAAAQAQHASVLAARDAVTPIERQPTPDELNGKEK